ncbi:ABC transporter substrate-binding protein [Sinisalibacter aestuarii]|uniref:ABC transporter substrate-binding protein n=1 Tax=Sinisalibacter aestuarii TaxID=2949426 RepID=A0ABQ5LU03_9RHOB|nr:ABC transporter substrate-binding protein [Sinisalibacter aestuarii]GKY88456.1 ABC transporter substrate-binding protein [Sinisalibacter aestuarii]
MRAALTILLWLFAIVPAAAEELRLGFLSLEDDPRFDEDYAYARIALRPQGDARAAVEMAIGDMKILTDARDLTVTLDDAEVADDALLAEAQRMVTDGARYLIVDLPADQVEALAAGLDGSGATILNTTAPDDWLRRRCHTNLLHTSASDRMIADALVQHLVRQKWSNVLVLTGKSPRDEARTAAFTEAATRFRLEITDTRPFDLSTNPALREQNNVMLLTGGRGNYDVIFIADEDGEFSRYVPYQTMLPRPVIGATGLVALEWHWALERYGAPQVNSRFADIADGRRMGWQDWSAWTAARAVLTAHAKSRDPAPEAIDAFLRSDRLRLDGSKGVPMTFRPWNGQLRMPIVLATHNAIIDIAPIEGFLHQTNTLDTLGQDEAEFACD